MREGVEGIDDERGARWLKDRGGIDSKGCGGVEEMEKWRGVVVEGWRGCKLRQEEGDGGVGGRSR